MTKRSGERGGYSRFPKHSDQMSPASHKMAPSISSAKHGSVMEAKRLAIAPRRAPPDCRSSSTFPFLASGRRRTQIQPIGPLRLRCRHHYCSRPRPRRIADGASFCGMRTPERGSGIVGTEERSPSGSTNPKCATIRRSSRTESRLNGPSGPLPSPTFAAEDPSTSAGHLIDERRARTGARRPKEAPTTRRRPFFALHGREKDTGLLS